MSSIPRNILPLISLNCNKSKVGKRINYRSRAGATYVLELDDVFVVHGLEQFSLLSEELDALLM